MNRDTGLLQLYSKNDVFGTYTLIKIDFNLNIETEKNEIETFAFLLTLDCINKTDDNTVFLSFPLVSPRQTISTSKLSTIKTGKATIGIYHLKKIYTFYGIIGQVHPKLYAVASFENKNKKDQDICNSLLF